MWAVAFTQSQLDALRDAYARGVLSVSHAGKTVTYRSLDDMERIIVTIERALAGSSRPKRYAVAAIPRRGH